MKTMSQVARMADCPETMDEARALIDQLDREVRRLRSNAYWDAENRREAYERERLNDWEQMGR